MNCNIFLQKVGGVLECGLVGAYVVKRRYPRQWLSGVYCGVLSCRLIRSGEYRHTNHHHEGADYVDYVESCYRDN